MDFTNNASAILKAFTRYRKGTPFVPDEPDPELCTRLMDEILDSGVFTRDDANEFTTLARTGTDAQMQFFISGLRVRFQARLSSSEDRKDYVYLLARLVKSFHFLTCFFTYPDELKKFVLFADYVGPQLIKQGNVSELMKEIRKTEVVKAAVVYQGQFKSAGGEIKLRSRSGRGGVAPPVKKVSVKSMIDEIRTKFDISDEEALYIKQVTEQKVADPVIHSTVQAHKEDKIFLEGAYRGQVHHQIEDTYDNLDRFDELADPKYTDTGGIFDIMSVTVIDTHLVAVA